MADIKGSEETKREKWIFWYDSKEESAYPFDSLRWCIPQHSLH